MPETSLIILYISGRVQGVGFRQSAKTMARFLGIRGIVKNLNDGRVYIEAEGVKVSLDAFVDWCRKGTQYGQVERVEKAESKPKGYLSFEIKF